MDENEEFSLVFTTHLNGHTIVYGAEMDGIRCDKSPVSKPPTEQGPEAVIDYFSTKEFIELKTNRHIDHSRQETSFRFVDLIIRIITHENIRVKDNKFNLK